MSHKTKRYTKKQLNRARLKVLAQEKAEAREEKAARYRAARREARALSIFSGCDPERTLDLLGEDA